MTTSSSESGGDALMESPVGDTKSATAFQSFTKAERIMQLNDIDKSITQLLQSAGLAIKTLTVHQTNSALSEDNAPTFMEATNDYLKGLHSVDVRLKRQIHGLHEAGIVFMPKSSAGRPDGQISDPSRVTGDNVALDVGWLNSRSGKVAQDMEAELWENARRFLEILVAKKNSGQGLGEIDNGSEDEDMVKLGHV